MSLKTLQNAMEPNRTLMRLIEDQERLRRLVAGPAGIHETLKRSAGLDDRLLALTGSTDLYRDALTEHQRRISEVAEAVERIAGTSLSRAIEQATLVQLPNSVVSLLRADLERYQSTLNVLGIRLAVNPAVKGVLGDYSGAIETRLSSIAAASAKIGALKNQASFANVGASVFAAGQALSDANIDRLDFRRTIDPFVGDWGRIDHLPEDYGDDEGARREILKEVEADEALRDVTTEEAAALLSQSSFTADGVPIVLLGEPIGLVVAEDPDDIAARLIRRVERAIRHRIDRVLRNKHGEDWPNALAPERATAWAEKRSSDEQNKLPPHSLIHYAEFMELADLLNQFWDQGFAGRIVKSRKVTERIRALSPHRNYTLHSRPVTPEQLLAIAYSVREIERFIFDEGDEGDNG